MGNSSSTPYQPAFPVTLPIGVLPEFTQHKSQIHLELEIEPCRTFKKGNDLQTVVRDSHTKQLIFTIGPIIRINKNYVQTLYSSSQVPLFTLTSTGSSSRKTTYICHLALTGEEIYRAVESTGSSSTVCIFTFKNLLGAHQQDMRIVLRKNGVISAWNLTVGKVAFYKGWNRKETHQLNVDPGIDVALMVISTMCLHRMDLSSRSRSRSANAANIAMAGGVAASMSASAAAGAGSCNGGGGF